MDESGFHVDETAFYEAVELTSQLSFQHKRIVSRPAEIFEHFEYSYRQPESQDPLTEPLRKIAQEIPIADVESDVRDFGLVAALANEFEQELPMVVIDPDLPPLPLLPAKESKIFTVSEPGVSPKLARYFFEEIMDSPAQRDVTKGSWESAQEVFFRGLGSFLAARIAGVRWARQTGHDSPGPYWGGGGGGGGGGGSLTTSGGPGSGFQKWTVHTQGSGNSLYYSGTHACRSGATYLNAPTTPIDVYLPMGTLFLAADAGPGGSQIWDPSMVTVPSFTPTFYTKRF